MRVEENVYMLFNSPIILFCFTLLLFTFYSLAGKRLRNTLACVTASSLNSAVYSCFDIFISSSLSW